MNAGRLKYTIVIQKPTNIKDGFGANSTIWEDIITTRADITNITGNRVVENDEIIYTYNKDFVVRIYHQIEEDYRIIWNNKKWRILSIEPDVQRQYLTINTELINE